MHNDEIQQRKIELLCRAAGEGKIAQVKKLLDQGVIPNGNALVTPLQSACEFNNLKIVQLLLKQKSIDIGKRAGPLQVDALYLATSKGHKNIVSLLLAHGAPCDQNSAEGFSPLAISCLKGYTEIAKMLIEAGASTSSAAHNGVTCLMLSRKVEISQLLLQGHADVMAVDKHLATATHHMSHNGCSPALIQLLYDHGAVMDARDCAGKTPRELALDARNNVLAQFIAMLETQQGQKKPRMAAKTAKTDNTTSSTRTNVPSSTVAEAVHEKEDSTSTSTPCTSFVHKSMEGDGDKDQAVAPTSTVFSGKSDPEDNIAHSTTDCKSTATTAPSTPPTHTPIGMHWEHVSEEGDEGSVASQNSDEEGWLEKPKKVTRKLKPCAHCSKLAYRRCAGCSSTYFCDRLCQKAAFKEHREECLALKDARIQASYEKRAAKIGEIQVNESASP